MTWKKITEFVPPKPGKYIVCNRNRVVFQAHYYGIVDGKPRFGLANKGDSITHWMELPDPPAEK